jgi:hypothetical protein
MTNSKEGKRKNEDVAGACCLNLLKISLDIGVGICNKVGRYNNSS